MRTFAAATTSLLAIALGCGDGVGHPVVSNEPAIVAASGQAGTENVGGAGRGNLAGASGGGAASTDPGGGGTSGQAPWGEGGLWDDFERWRGPDPREANSGRGGANGLDAVPMGAHCASVSKWNARSDAAELELLQFLNFARTQGLRCGGVDGAAVSPLVMEPELRCAARLHARDMSERAFFDHVNPDGLAPEERMRNAGYVFGVAGESIAQAQGNDSMIPYEPLEELLEEGGEECTPLLDARFVAIGIGFFEGFWTLDLAGP